ncbi:MAG: DUF6314 family protein [Pseudomonadota bacterium]
MNKGARSLMDFAGVWTITRRIEDRLAGLGRFEGAAQFASDDAGLRYVEDGVLTLSTGASMRAERAYLWREGEAGLIDVLFDDGRPFHRFDPNAGGAGERHYCDPDIYDVVYEVDDWPNWSSTWTVTGPRKNYTLRSDYGPADNV